MNAMNASRQKTLNYRVSLPSDVATLYLGDRWRLGPVESMRKGYHLHRGDGAQETWQLQWQLEHSIRGGAKPYIA